MKKVIVGIICVIVMVGAIFTAVTIFNFSKENKKENIELEIAEENILDECTEEYKEQEYKNILQANSDEEKISPYCSFTINTYYKKCGHTKNEYKELPEELVNCTKKEIEEKYKDYKIEKFANNEIVLYQEKNGECGEHYILKDTDGKAKVYLKKENGEEELIEETDISIDYLPETDKINMKKGIEVNGKQKLNQLIEDFE